jgi:hypothetical protein
MKTSLAAVIAFLFVGGLFAADRKELKWTERSSVESNLKESGYGYLKLTVLSGYKEPMDDKKDGPGWSIFARCQNKEKIDYNVKMWVSDDWKKGRVISAKKRDSD